MQRFTPGDRVRIDIPDETDPDHALYHDTYGTVIEVAKDDGSDMTGDPRDDIRYRVELDADEVVDFRWRDLRPAPER
ncbi:hypothetical protein [Haloglomus salinum]|uniref:hypothetical protein n=1 Tax=Haloglomus salinum TaxID=2962673 RepID=UPI0020C9A915|nr:hypothetical protein [Haloglomus salinum]